MVYDINTLKSSFIICAFALTFSLTSCGSSDGQTDKKEAIEYPVSAKPTISPIVAIRP